MVNSHSSSKTKQLTFLLPTPLRNLIKRIYLRTTLFNNKIRFVRKGRFSYLGSHFRFNRQRPYYACIGGKTHVEAFNIWDAQSGNIAVSNNCFFGLHNLVMGPVQIGNNVNRADMFVNQKLEILL